MPIICFLVYNGLNTYLDAITIYRCINILEKNSKPTIQTLLTFLHGCMTSKLVDNKRNFIPSRVFMESNPFVARTWGLNKFNINFPNLCTLNQEPVPASDPTASSSDINLNSFQHFISSLKLTGISHTPAITKVSTEPIMEDIYFMRQEEIDLHLNLCGMNTGKNHHYHHTCTTSLANISLRVFNTMSSHTRCATPSTMTVTASQYLPLSSRQSKRGSTSQKSHT